MRRNLKFLLLIITLLILNILILFFRIENQNNTPKLFYGKIIPEISFYNTHGKIIPLKKFNLLYFTSLQTSKDIRIAKFLNILYQKYSNSDLQVIGIVDLDKYSTRKFIEEERVSFPFINYKDNPSINKIFGQLFHTIILLDSSNTIRFIASFFTQNDIRQLIEKFIEGRISYPPFNKLEYLKEGDIYPTFRVKNLKNGNLGYFPRNNNTLAIVLTGRCPDCILEKFKTFIPLIEEILPYSNEENKEIVLIFSSKYLEKDILKVYRDVNLEILLANGSIPGIEDSYNSIYYFNTDIVVVDLDKENVISYINSLDNFIKYMKGKNDKEMLVVLSSFSFNSSFCNNFCRDFSR